MNTDEIPVDWSSFPRRRESYNTHYAIIVRLLPRLKKPPRNDDL
ncbi:hypothetical protein SRABI36_03766 [Pedobacter sp. Bi36]|nr:hypothetical protein SRABI36_03766 [Pedobacter sp. Bi36]CAH0299279.1 hypothetical protein SRABI126_04317 [Pedobacter sp. Bi126]